LSQEGAAIWTMPEHASHGLLSYLWRWTSMFQCVANQ